MRVFSASLCMLVGAVLAAATADAQGTVRVVGHVFDDGMDARLGIESVQVQLIAVADTTRRVGVITDRQGRFVVDGLTKGRYHVRIARIGYNRMEWERSFDRSEDTLTVGVRPSNSGDYTCPTDSVLEPHFLLMVRDQDARPVTSGITIVARSDAEVDTLRKSDYAFSATPSRAGTYVFEATGPGFLPARSSPVTVRRVSHRAGSLCGIPIPRLLFIERVGTRLRSPHPGADAPTVADVVDTPHSQSFSAIAHRMWTT